MNDSQPRDPVGRFGTKTGSPPDRDVLDVGSRQVELDQRLTKIADRFNNRRLLLAVDHSLPAGIVRCVECGRFAGEDNPSHDCPVQTLIEAKIPLGRARDLARAGIETPEQAAVWRRAIDELGVTEAGAFKQLGYSPIDARRAADAGQSGYTMLVEAAEIEDAANEPAPAPKPKPQRKPASKIVPPPDIDLVDVHAGWVAAVTNTDTDREDLVSFELNNARFRQAMSRVGIRTRGQDAVVLVGDGNGNLVVTDQWGITSEVIPDVGTGVEPWAIALSSKESRALLDGKSSTIELAPDGVMRINGLHAPRKSCDLPSPTTGLDQMVLTPMPPGVSELIADTARSASNDTARAVITGVLVKRGDHGGVLAVATDSYRLRIRGTPDMIPSDGEPWPKTEVGDYALIDAKAARAGVTALGVDGNDGAAIATHAGTVVSCRNNNAEYPAWQNLVRLPGGAPDRTVALANSPQIRKKMKQATHDASPIRVDADVDGNVRIYGSFMDADGMRAVSEVHRDAGYNEDNATLVGAFNADYLAAIMECHDGPVVMRSSDPTKQVVFDHPNGLDVLMTVRIT